MPRERSSRCAPRTPSWSSTGSRCFACSRHERYRIAMTLTRVFIPNRGEIALRIVHACRELGLQTVVGASDVDRDELAARSADATVCIGPGPAPESYLRDEIVVQAALGTGCDAIHPGS